MRLNARLNVKKKKKAKMIKAESLQIGDYVLNEETDSLEQIVGITNMDYFNNVCEDYDCGYNLIVRLFPSGNSWKESENLIKGVEINDKFLTDNGFVYDEKLEAYVYKNTFFKIIFNLESNSLMFSFIFADENSTLVPILQHDRFYVHHIQHLFKQLNIIHEFVINV